MAGSIFKETYWVKAPDGTKEKRKSEWWYIRFYNAYGKRRKMKAAPTKAQAGEILAKKLSEVASEKAGLPTMNARELKLRDLIRRYLDSQRPRVTPRHLQCVGNELRRSIAAMSVFRVGDMTREKVENYLNKRTESGLSPRTVNVTLTRLKALFNWGVKVGELPINPIACVSLRPGYEKRHERRAMTDDEAARLIDVLDEGWLRVSVLLALYCGLRVSEIRKLQWSDIDLEARKIRIRPETEKNRKGATLPIHSILRDVLSDWRGRTLPGPGAKVVKMHSKPVVPLRKALKKAGIPYQDESGRFVDWHALRHTFLTNLARQGVGMKEIQSLGRHSTAALTLGTYLHSSQDREADAVSLLPDFTSGIKSVALKEGTTDLSYQEAECGPRAVGESMQRPGREDIATAETPSFKQWVEGSSPSAPTRKTISVELRGGAPNNTGHKLEQPVPACGRSRSTPPKSNSS